MQVDAVDWKIIELLSGENQPNNTIARKLGVSEGTVRRRIGLLRQAGVLLVRGMVNPEVLQNQQLAMVAVNVAESSLLEAKAREISKIKGVISVSIVSGRYDLLVEVLVDSNRGLVDFLTSSLSKVKGISKTESFLLLKTYNKFIAKPSL